jgi:hypothetical protein
MNADTGRPDTDPTWAPIQQHLRLALASARAAKGWKWTDVARELGKRGWRVSAGNLMTRHSRMSFRADELLMLMDVLGMAAIGRCPAAD